MKQKHAPSRLGPGLLLACLLAAGIQTGCASSADVSPQVRQVASAFVRAINRGDAAAAAACWTDDGEFVRESDGVRLTGREAILEALGGAITPEAGIKTETTSSTIRVVAPGVVAEEGRSRTTRKDGPVEKARFVALYVQRNGRWKIHRVWQTDLPDDSHYQRLRPLAWMIGEWTDRKDGKEVKTVCRWSKNRNFITRTFEVSEAGSVVASGTEVIGWDPAEQQVRSWTFDSKGGFAQGRWRPQGGQWQLASMQEVAPGELAQHQTALKDLDWLVGRWRDRDEPDALETTYQWTRNKAFLVARFKASGTGRDAQEGVRIIGWDPKRQRLRSWVFDTDGGFAEAAWSRKADGDWVTNYRHVLPDGRRASSIAICRKVDDDTFTWRKVSRELDGELLPNDPEITVVRTPAGE